MIVRTSKLDDADILEILGQLLVKFPDGQGTAILSEGVRRDFDEQADIDSYEFDRAARNIQSFSFSCQSQEPNTIQFKRGNSSTEFAAQHGEVQGFTRRVPSAFYDELAFFEPGHRTGNHVPLSDDTKIWVSELINSYSAPTDSSSDDDARKLSKVVSKQIDDLRKLNLSMTKDLARARQEQDQAFSVRQLELDEKFNARLEDLVKRESDLERLRSELNDREPQHERRRLREHLTGRLQSTIAEPPQRATLREWYSNFLYLFVGLLFIAVSVGLAWKWDAGSTADGSAAFWARSAKSLASGIAGAAFAWAGLSGVKATARAAREYEQQMQRYAFDMDRASWIVETILQMNAAETAQVPDEWLVSVCRDLFAVSGRKADEPRSLESFAALFDATAKARIGTSGVEFEIDRKGAKKLANEG